MLTRQESPSSAAFSRLRRAASAMAVALGLGLGLSACGGGGGGGAGSTPPPPPPPTGIGPQGGTVNGPNGASLVVPAGALNQFVDLQITEIDRATTSLRPEVEQTGAIYALTPHGTTFSAPATLNLPFDSAQVPDGRTLQLLKTTDAGLTAWSGISGTINGATLSAGIMSLSNATTALVPAAPEFVDGPEAVAVAPGGPVTFSVTVARNGGPVLDYQWLRNGEEIPGATDADYSLEVVEMDDDGALFSVRVDNGIGEIDSPEVALQVVTEVTGTVTAPDGRLASAQPALLQRLLAVLLPDAAWAQAIGGYTPVPGANVFLIRITDAGAPTGNPVILAQTTTNAAGLFSLALPPGTVLGGNLIVQVTTAAAPQPVPSAGTLNAPATGATVDVNPLTEELLQQVLTYLREQVPSNVRPIQTLADFSADELGELLRLITEALVANPDWVAATAAETYANLQANLLGGTTIRKIIGDLGFSRGGLQGHYHSQYANGTVGVDYDQPQFHFVIPSTAKRSYEIASGDLPPGLSLDAATGRITGTPSAAGTFTFDLSFWVFRENSGLGAGTIKPFTITIEPSSTPTIAALNPANQTIQVGSQGSMSLRLSAAQGTDTTVLLSASPAGVVAIPTSVQVPALQLSVSIAVTGVAPGQAQVTASLGASSASVGVTVDPIAPMLLNLTGVWRNDYRCVSEGGAVETGLESILVSQAGSDVTLISDPFSAKGTISGDVMSYSGSGPGYTEQGTWTRDGSDDQFAKASSYRNTDGSTGTCTGTLRRQPLSVATFVATGSNHTLAIKDDGTLWAWGRNRSGELGIGSPEERILVPTQVGTAADWTRISASVDHTVALRADGSLWAWGWNSQGQLGDGTTSARLSPVRIGTGNDWRAIAAGSFHTVALRTDGTLWAWGGNGAGQLGDGTVDPRLVPTQVGTASDWVSIAAARAHTLAVKSDGSLWAWGDNANGQLGDGTTGSRLVPTRIGTASNWTGVAAGIRHSLAVRTDGTLWAWGENTEGQLGDGTLSTRLVPTRIGGDADWITVVGGTFNTSLAVKSDGTLWGWGNNSHGQLGNDTGVNENVPVRIGTANTWTAVAVGSWHVVGIQAGGTLWAWGYNLNGEHGDGTREGKFVPTQMPF